MTPLTPTERAALDAAKASFDAERNARIDKCWRKYMQTNDLEAMRGYRLAATILARQVAERLTIG